MDLPFPQINEAAAQVEPRLIAKAPDGSSEVNERAVIVVLIEPEPAEHPVGVQAQFIGQHNLVEITGCLLERDNLVVYAQPRMLLSRETSRSRPASARSTVNVR